jgi:kinesin family protein 2/24
MPTSKKALIILSLFQVNIVGATEVEVTSGAELTALLEQAARYRLTATTFKNDTSSRSHAVCRIRYRRGSGSRSLV